MKSASLNKGIISLIMIVLFIGLSVNPLARITANEKSTIPILRVNTLYVGGTGLDNYSSIQDAIDNASDGDTVFVYDEGSPYYEQLVINKTIYLIGEDKYSTVINAQYVDTPVKIHDVDNCLVSGFTIQNCHWSGTEYSQAVVEIIRSDYVNIRGNILTIGDTSAIDWTSAVELDNCTYCIVQDNIMFEDDYKSRTVGVVLHDGSYYNTVSGNDISNYTYGVKTTNLNENLYNKYNVIVGNHIHHNRIGIEILGDTYNEILNNRIEYNKRKGIDNTMAHNTNISGNIISYNGIGWEFNCGIMLTWGTKNNYISNNVISNNNPTGIFMLTAVDNIVTKNNFIDNWGDSDTLEMWWGNAYFNYEINQWKFLRLNRWDGNYWSDSLGILPKAINGVMEIFFFYFPRLEFDWRPAKEPYDI
jgi:parallel beta-helix repeat protein